MPTLLVEDEVDLTWNLYLNVLLLDSALVYKKRMETRHDTPTLGANWKKASGLSVIWKNIAGKMEPRMFLSLGFKMKRVTKSHM